MPPPKNTTAQPIMARPNATVNQNGGLAVCGKFLPVSSCGRLSSLAKLLLCSSGVGQRPIEKGFGKVVWHQTDAVGGDQERLHQARSTASSLNNQYGASLGPMASPSMPVARQNRQCLGPRTAKRQTANLTVSKISWRRFQGRVLPALVAVAPSAPRIGIALSNGPWAAAVAAALAAAMPAGPASIAGVHRSILFDWDLVVRRGRWGSSSLEYAFLVHQIHPLGGRNGREFTSHFLSLLSQYHRKPLQCLHLRGR